MKKVTSFSKKILIGALVIIITILHLGSSGNNMALHVLHRELYFLPILLSAFWFGMNAGFMVSLLVGFLYASYILAYTSGHVGMVTVIPQVFVFILIGTILGWLADREKELQKKRMTDNNVIILGRAASAVSHEMKQILSAMKSMFGRAGGLKQDEYDRDYEAELGRLDKMVDILSSYAKPEKGRIFSHDLNVVVLDRVKFFEKEALEKGIILKTSLDPEGCPSWIDPDKISWVLDKIIQNAMEVSGSGDTIGFSSRRGGEYCTVSIRDQGPGIKPEHLEKIFTPFFTTKPDGHGLALAGCRKSLHDLGGDIKVKSTLGNGAEFIITVPREPAGKSLAQDPVAAVFRGQGDSQLTRE
ncbi:MAG: HAMP domain-containing histidine kinase [Desulfobulbaceae bacterium]|nr:HAMP domain-containing histidine kinase [Desulfobulbaceae bacterium]